MIVADNGIEWAISVTPDRESRCCTTNCGR
jgi:hypothetical protein